jgi:hypothetical protein
MGLFGAAGLKSLGQSVAQIIASLVGQDVVAKSFMATQASGSNAFLVQTTGARVKFGAGTLDFITSDGAITLTSAGSFTVGGDLTLGATSDAFFNRNARVVGNLGLSGGVLLVNGTTAPTVVAGAGASVVNNNGTAAFTINLGGAAGTGTITLPTATTGWVCYMQDVTNPDSTVIQQTGGSQTTVTFKSYSRTTGAAANWTANDIMRCIAFAY